MDQPPGKQVAPSTSQDGPPGSNAAVPPKQAYKMNQVPPPQQQVVQQAIMSADGGYQILAMPGYQILGGMGQTDWQTQIMSLAQAQTILNIPGLGPVQALDPAAFAAANAAADAAHKPRKRAKTGRPRPGQAGGPPGQAGLPGSNPQVTLPTYAALPDSAGGEMDVDDEYEDVSSDEQNAYDVLRTWQQAREESGGKEGRGDGGPADADSGAPFAGDLPRRKRTRRERENARGAAAGSRLAAALSVQQAQQIQQQQMALAAQAGLAGLPAGLLPLHLAAGNLSDLLVPYVGGPAGLAPPSGMEDPAMRPPEMMVPAVAPLNTELPAEPPAALQEEFMQEAQQQAEAAMAAAQAASAAAADGGHGHGQGTVSDALMMAPAEEVAALSGALAQEQQAVAEQGAEAEAARQQEMQEAQQEEEKQQKQQQQLEQQLEQPPAPPPEQRRPRVYHTGRSRRLHDSKVHWPDGKKLLDGRILIPHSFILEHFGQEATFPQTPGGEVIINGEVHRENLKLRLYSTSNNVKSTGQGNFWLTGVQPIIKQHQDVKVISVEMLPTRELRIVLTSQGLWTTPGTKGTQRKGRIRSGENGPVQMYDGRIHLPLSLVNQHLQGMQFPYHLTGIYHIMRGSTTVVHEVQARVVQYRKHKNDNKYNYWLTGHQSVLKMYNDLRVQQVEWEREGVVRVHLIGPPPPGENHSQMVAPEITAAAASVANSAGASQLPPLAPLNAMSFGAGLPAASIIQLGAGGPYVPLFATNLGAGQQLLPTAGLEGLSFVDGVQQVQLSAEQLAQLQQMMGLGPGLGLELVQHSLQPQELHTEHHHQQQHHQHHQHLMQAVHEQQRQQQEAVEAAQQQLEQQQQEQEELAAAHAQAHAHAQAQAHAEEMAAAHAHAMQQQQEQQRQQEEEQKAYAAQVEAAHAAHAAHVQAQAAHAAHAAHAQAQAQAQAAGVHSEGAAAAAAAAAAAVAAAEGGLPADVGDQSMHG